MLLAVPGSGKTTVLAARLGYMVYCAGILPENILTLTYTVTAAHDMSNRFGAYFGDELKNMMLTDDEIGQLDEETGFKISEIYKEYRRELRIQSQMDYDDQMVYDYNILKRSPETLHFFQDKFSYICVDEAQDTSKIQHEIIRLLAGSKPIYPKEYTAVQEAHDCNEGCQVQTAVLYRNNESALSLIDLLERRGISYHVRNMELSFFTHRVVQDVRNMICFAMNPKNTELYIMGYGDYLDRAGSLQNPISVILSTIHSSKDLEYDHVYFLDVVDGVFPETVPKNLKTVDKMEQRTYEEERRLFYVGITRAKSKLSAFKLDQKSTFCQELMYKEKAVTVKTGKETAQKKVKTPPIAYIVKKKPLLQEGYGKFLNAIGDGLIVRHKKLGEAVVVEVQE